MKICKIMEFKFFIFLRKEIIVLISCFFRIINKIHYKWYDIMPSMIALYSSHYRYKRSMSKVV